MTTIELEAPLKILEIGIDSIPDGWYHRLIECNNCFVKMKDQKVIVLANVGYCPGYGSKSRNEDYANYPIVKYPTWDILEGTTESTDSYFYRYTVKSSTSMLNGIKLAPFSYWMSGQRGRPYYCDHSAIINYQSSKSHQPIFTDNILYHSADEQRRKIKEKRLLEYTNQPLYLD